MYHRPTINRKTIIVQIFVAKLDIEEKTNAVITDVCMTFFLPHVSAMNPQKWDERIIPINPTEFKMPCSEGMTAISHPIYGRIKPIDWPSTTEDIIEQPHSKSIK